jgi:phosphoglycolate phosphatase
LFVDAIGASPEGLTKTKAEMLAFLAKKHNFSLSNTILVGDTAHDARAARDAGVLFYGVTFGYGTKTEMEEVGWQKLYTSVEELHEGLLAQL